MIPTADEPWFPGDDAAIYGASLFETIAAYCGEIPLLYRHWRRLTQSAATFDWPAPSRDDFEAALLAAHDPTKDEVLRYTWLRLGGPWSPRSAGFGFQIFVRPARPAPSFFLLLPASMPLTDQDSLRCHKMGSRLIYQLEAERARTLGFDDALFYDRQGRLLETSRANFFLKLDGEWLTPPLRLGLLPGIARALILEAGQAREQELHIRDLERCEAVMICNAVWGKVPVSETAKLRAAFPPL